MIAALISILSFGASICAQLEGVRYFVINYFRDSLVRPLVTTKFMRLANSPWTSCPYFSSLPRSSPKISKTSLSKPILTMSSACDVLSRLLGPGFGDEHTARGSGSVTGTDNITRSLLYSFSNSQSSGCNAGVSENHRYDFLNVINNWPLNNE